jgi:hypothetical protein
MQLLNNGLFIFSAFVSPFSSYLRRFGSAAEDAPKRKNIYNNQTDSAFFLCGLLTLSAYLSPFSSYLRIVGSAAKDAPPSGENILNE